MRKQNQAQESKKKRPRNIHKEPSRSKVNAAAEPPSRRGPTSMRKNQGD